MKMFIKVLLCLLFPIALIVDLVTLLISIVGIFDGGGEIGCVGMTEWVYDKLTGKPSPKAPLPAHVVNERTAQTAPKKAGFDWARFIIWGGLAVLLGFGVFVFWQARGLIF